MSNCSCFIVLFILRWKPYLTKSNNYVSCWRLMERRTLDLQLVNHKAIFSFVLQQFSFSKKNIFCIIQLIKTNFASKDFTIFLRLWIKVDKSKKETSHLNPITTGRWNYKMLNSRLNWDELESRSGFECTVNLNERIMHR